MLIKNDGENAKEYIITKLNSPEDKEIKDQLSFFGQYTLEALIVHVLSVLFHSSCNTSDESESMIRTATLIETLDRYVRDYARYLRSLNIKKMEKVDKDGLSGKGQKSSGIRYRIGVLLVSFMAERELIVYEDTQNQKVIHKSGDSYYLKHASFVICNFNISELPMKLNLPMVCKPIDWSYPDKEEEEEDILLSNLSGGYLTQPLGYMQDRYSLLASSDQSRFNIYFTDKRNLKEMCKIMNKLQGQKFKINSSWLEYIQENEDQFVEWGLLKPKFLCSVNTAKASALLRELHISNPVILKSYRYSELLKSLNSDINIACFEQRVLKLAKAFDGYTFYIPAFLDFRGRIYRSGFIHFHERDLVRSLILFEGNKTEMDLQVIKAAVGFHYQKFPTYYDALLWYNENHKEFENNNFVRDAKNPFQFMSKYLAVKTNNSQILANTPITQDASASAFQILSYFLLNEELAERTNLFQSKDGRIQDIYLYFLSDLKDYFKMKLSHNTSLLHIALKHLTRDLVKKIFMPIIYGKTIRSTAEDLFKGLSHFITYKEALILAQHCFGYWNKKYKGVDSLINLIRHTSWIASAVDSPVYYNSSYYCTIQDYIIYETIKLSVYDRIHKKRRQICLRVPTDKRNRMKTLTSTFANFIHQKDANIAMHVVNNLSCDNYLSYDDDDNIPIYTVHDNFLTNSSNCFKMKTYYIKAFHSLPSPLEILFHFLYINLFKTKDEGRILLNRIEESGFIIPPEAFDNYIDFPISKNLKKSYDERLRGLRESYYQYVRAISKDSDSTEDYDKYHQSRLEHFKRNLKNGNHYCVHL